MQVNGWTLFGHPAFGEPYEALVAEVGRLAGVDSPGYQAHPKAKLLKRITDLITVEIPADPGGTWFDLGNTLGPANRHWRRGKFLGRFRLFFRYSSKDKIIVYGWVNDESTLRKAGAKTDVYETFAARLKRGQPPSGWDNLLEGAALVAGAAQR